MAKKADLTPGYYQGRQAGLKSGRMSPRDALRPSRSDSIDAAHGIVSSGSIDPHQGQLFNTKQIPSVPHADIVRRAGGAPADPLANHKGFMPGLQTHKQKIAGIKRIGESRARTGADRGTGSPIRESMEDRAAVHAQGRDRDWYASRAAEGHLGPGAAGNLVADVAARQGVSHARATRAVAVTSPRTSWSKDNDPHGGRDFGMSRPNIESAENVISTVKGLGPDPLHSRIVEAAGGAEGRSLGGMKAKAGVEFAKGEPRRTIPVADPAASKVPNFEQSLHLDNPSKVVQAQAARSYTVDVHDTRAMGGDEAMLKTAGGYHAAAMLGRRAALKAGELAPRFQSRSWEVIRSQEAPESMGHGSMFKSTRSGALVPDPRSLPGVSARRSLAEGGSDDRSDFAKKMGIEF